LRFVPHRAVCRVCLGLSRGHSQNMRCTVQCAAHDSCSCVSIRKSRVARCLTRCAVGLPPTCVTAWFRYDSPGVRVHLVKKRKKKREKTGNKNITTGRFQEGSVPLGSLHAAACPTFIHVFPCRAQLTLGSRATPPRRCFVHRSPPTVLTPFSHL
jgi:hypothetical protein